MKKESIYKSRKEFYAFIRSHNLLNRIYDMVCYFGLIKNLDNSHNIKKCFLRNLEDIVYVETLAKFFEKKCNLKDLIYDLDYLKQYLV